MRINLRGVMLGCRAAVPHMIAGGGGSIVNTASSRAFTGTVDSAGYGTSKLAVVGLTRYVATQYGKQGVRCNAIAPGVVVTERSAAKLGDAEYAGILRHYLTPRLGTPDDVAACALWLASDAAGFVTGQGIHVDGGLGAHQPNYAELQDLAGRTCRTGGRVHPRPPPRQAGPERPTRKKSSTSANRLPGAIPKLEKCGCGEPV
jgi:hypothetical protein